MRAPQQFDLTAYDCDAAEEDFFPDFPGVDIVRHDRCDVGPADQQDVLCANVPCIEPAVNDLGEHLRHSDAT